MSLLTILLLIEVGSFVQGTTLDSFLFIGEGACIPGHNDYTDITTTSEECAQLCYDLHDCVSFEWKSDGGNCQMSKMSTEEAGIDYTCDGLALYERRAYVSWGSFDTTVVLDSGKQLSLRHSSNHDTMRSFIFEMGGTVAEATQTLTTDYLSGVDIFFSSWVSRGLSVVEQTALKEWIYNGGVLIVTVRDDEGENYMTFTKMFGIATTGFPYANNADIAIPDSSIHPIMTGVEAIRIYDNSWFLVKDFVDVIATDAAGMPVMAVLEDIGTGCGAILVTNWHPWYDNYGPFLDNTRFLQNAIKWSHGRHGVLPPPPAVSFLQLDDLNECEDRVY